MRVAIVGGGAVGNMAAWRLARYGAEVLLIEQFALDHDRGSSYGDSRIIRRVYPDGLYTELMAGAYPLWQELMTQANDDALFVQSGGLYFAPADHPDVRASIQALTQSDVPHEVLTPKECARKFPAFRLAENEVAISEPSMGYARASKCVRAASALAHDTGKVRTLWDTKVTRIESGGKAGGVRLALDDGQTLYADALILCAGAWTNTLLKPFDVQIPLKVTRQVYFHLAPKEPDDPQFAPGAFPVWIDGGTLFYGFRASAMFPASNWRGIRKASKPIPTKSIARSCRTTLARLWNLPLNASRASAKPSFMRKSACIPTRPTRILLWTPSRICRMRLYSVRVRGMDSSSRR